MSPEDAVAKLAEIVAERDEFSEDEIIDAMTAVGIPDPVAFRAYRFTQTAWAHALLADLGVRLSPDYLCLNAAGEVVETGQYASEPHYVVARNLVPRYAGSPGFRRLALMAADVQAVNGFLNSGSKPEDLVTSAGFIFLETPTPAGIENANRVFVEHMAALRQTNPGPADPSPHRTAARTPPTEKKPWWRLWG